MTGLFRLCGFATAMFAIFGPVNCVRLSEPFDYPEYCGIISSVQDATTHETLWGAHLTARSSESEWKLEQTDSGLYCGVYAPGTYTLHVEAEGYRSQTIEGVAVYEQSFGDFQGFSAATIIVILEPID